MKPSWEWTEDDILSLKDSRAQESLYLEFKSSASLAKDDRKRDELSKDVSAFANSEGGDILYGVSEYGKAPSSFGDIDNGIDPHDITPEWVEQVIQSRIQPRINGIRINPIELRRTCQGRFLYAIHVPSSPNAPHQASDRRYYKRFNFNSVPMEDYEIRDVRNRQQRPALRLDGEILTARRSSLFNWRTSLKYLTGSIGMNAFVVLGFDLRIWLINKGEAAAEHCQIILSFDNLKIEKVKGLAARLDDLREKPSLQWNSIEGIAYPNQATKIMDIRLRVLDYTQQCGVFCEVSAANFDVYKRDYRFYSTGAFLAQARNMDGSKVRISLEGLERMWQKTDDV
ncbi:helix-turn-helix domain-containing protein [Chloroflexota bacterium]